MTFRFRPGLFIATIIALTTLVSLGNWQLHRLAWKRALIAETNERLSEPAIPFQEALKRAETGEQLEYQPVFIEGEYENSLEAHVFGTYDGDPGAFVFTPLKADAGNEFVYVNRGFVPQKLIDMAMRQSSEIDGNVRVEGLFRSAERPVGPAAWVRPKDQPKDNLYFMRDPQILAAAHSLDAPSYYIDSSGKESVAPWPKGATTIIDFPNRHLEYALTWFGLAAALVGVYLAFSIQRR